MSNQSEEVYDNNRLIFASGYLVYHVRMYAETLLWLQDNKSKLDGWDTVRNAMIEAHLVHSRILIQFICKDSTSYDTDVLAVHYFHDTPGLFTPLKCDSLKTMEKAIGGQLVHLTIKAGKLKSEQEWPVRKTADILIPKLKEFFGKVSDNKLRKGVKQECLEHLKKLLSQEIPVKLHGDT